MTKKTAQEMLDELMSYAAAYASQQTGAPITDFLKEPYRTAVREKREKTQLTHEVK